MYKKKHLLIYLVLLTLPIVSCTDDNGTGPDNGETASLTVEGQGTANGNTVTIPQATVEEDGWVVIHRSNADNDGPMVPDIIGKAMLNAGTNTDVNIQLTESVSSNEKLWAMLHHDTGAQGEYEFTGASSPDQPIKANDEIVTKAFVISQTDPSVSAQDQDAENDEFTVNVSSAEDGWIVIHRANTAGDGPMVPDIIAKAHVDAGSSGDVTVPLNDGETVATGDLLFPMLHYDTGTEGEYEFTGADSPDQPVKTDGSIVLTSFTVIQ